MKASDPRFEKINELANAIAQAKNTQIWFDLNRLVVSGELDKLMLPVAVADLEERLNNLLKVQGNSLKELP